MILFYQTRGSIEDLARERKERMEAKKVFGGSPIFSHIPHLVPISKPPSPTKPVSYFSTWLLQWFASFPLAF
jgi:hypothetical protein